MNAVIDTNVVAYFLLGTLPFAAEARTCIEALDTACAPAVWEAELANVLWMASRHDVVTIDEAATRLTLAGSLGIHSVPDRTLWQGALLRAHQASIPVYDTLFVELAVRERLPLVTFDATLLKAFPEVATRPASVRERAGRP